MSTAYNFRCDGVDCSSKWRLYEECANRDTADFVEVSVVTLYCSDLSWDWSS